MARVLLPLLLGSAAEAQVVSIPGLGSVRGSTEAGVAMFKGIPYAEPPIGRLRWQPPVAHSPWSSTTLDATDFGAQCLQRSSGQNPSAYNESCLYLNVFAPAAKPAKPLPVMLWIHGGAYVSGGSNGYRGQGIVRGSENNVVVVTINCPCSSSLPRASLQVSDRRCAALRSPQRLRLPRRARGPAALLAQHQRQLWHRGPAAGDDLDARAHRGLRRQSRGRHHLRRERGRELSDQPLVDQVVGARKYLECSARTRHAEKNKIR